MRAGRYGSPEGLGPLVPRKAMSGRVSPARLRGFPPEGGGGGGYTCAPQACVAPPAGEMHGSER